MKRESANDKMVGLYTFLCTVRHSKELSKERCRELEDLLDTLLVHLMENYYNDSRIKQ